MKVLVGYATRHGATAGIGQRVAAVLTDAGLEVDLARIDTVGDISKYDAFVIGSAAYYFHWLKEASSFVRRHVDVLRDRPVWLFSSGPVGPDKVDAEGHDILKGAEPKEFVDFLVAINPRDEHVFFGAFDPDAEPVGLMERVTRMLPAVREALPTGDFRDWAEIDRWAEGIASELKAVAQPVPVPA